MSSTIKISFIGDLMCQMQQIKAIARQGLPYGMAFEKIKPALAESDYVVGNLETPVAGRAMRYAFEETRFNAPDGFLESIKELGVNFLSMANNHCLDRGVVGADITLDKVRKLGFDSSGVYKTKEESEEICVKEIQGVKFAFISCTFETNQGRRSDLLPDDLMWKVDQIAPPKPYFIPFPLKTKLLIMRLIPYDLKVFVKRLLGRGMVSAGEDYLPDCTTADDICNPLHERYIKRIIDKIHKAKNIADFVVVLPHIGGQYNPEPGPFQKWTVKWMADAGADFIICNHAHTALQIETLSSGVFVAYALGNFSLTPGVGYYRQGCQADSSVILNLYFDSETKKVVYKTISVTENVLTDNGVSVVIPADPGKIDTQCVVTRVTGVRPKQLPNGEYPF